MLEYLVILYVWYRLAMLFLQRKRWFREHLGPFFYAVVGILLGGLVLDAAFHFVPATILFKDWPHEWTLSERLERYRSDPKWHGTYQLRWADFICERILNPYNYEVGKPHC
jgi:hypothetical protein